MFFYIDVVSAALFKYVTELGFNDAANVTFFPPSVDGKVPAEVESLGVCKNFGVCECEITACFAASQAYAGYQHVQKQQSTKKKNMLPGFFS